MLNRPGFIKLLLLGCILFWVLNTLFFHLPVYHRHY